MSIFKKGLAAFVIVAVLALPSFSSAKDPGNAWLDCGIGAIIFPDHQVVAGISNIIWDLGTTAVTSYSSSKDTCMGANATAALLINETYSSIEEETVKGEGQHLTAMLDILGCEGGAHTDIIGSVQDDFSLSLQDEAYSAKSSTQKAQDYYGIVQDKVSGEFAGQCQSGTL